MLESACQMAGPSPKNCLRLRRSSLRRCLSCLRAGMGWESLGAEAEGACCIPGALRAKETWCCSSIPPPPLLASPPPAFRPHYHHHHRPSRAGIDQASRRPAEERLLAVWPTSTAGNLPDLSTPPGISTHRPALTLTQNHYGA